MTGSDYPIRSAEAEYAKSYLYDDFNDIDFFIEDTDITTKKIFLKLLQRAFSDEMKIAQIFSLGGRDKVIEKYNNRDTSRKQLYIIDGDLYLMYEDLPFQKGLITLEKYSIENYLFDKKAICELLYDECNSECDFDDLCTRFSLDNWLKQQQKMLIRLFTEYAIEKKNQLGFQTVKYSVTRLLDSGHHDFLDRKLLSKRVVDIRKNIQSLLIRDNYFNDRYTVNTRVRNKRKDILIFVSIKDYVFPLLFRRIRTFSSINTNDKSYKFRLSKTCSIDELKSLIIRHLE